MLYVCTFYGGFTACIYQQNSDMSECGLLKIENCQISEFTILKIKSGKTEQENWFRACYCLCERQSSISANQRAADEMEMIHNSNDITRIENLWPKPRK